MLDDKYILFQRKNVYAYVNCNKVLFMSLHVDKQSLRYYSENSEN